MIIITYYYAKVKDFGLIACFKLDRTYHRVGPIGQQDTLVLEGLS